MSRTNERSAQGDRVKPGYELQPVNEDDQRGQTDEDLGAKWGIQGEPGPRVTRRGTTRVQSIPGGLEAAPDELEPQLRSLDQSDTDGDRLNKIRLDQSSREDGDRQQSGLDQSSREDGDRQQTSLDQAQGANDRPSAEIDSDTQRVDTEGSGGASDSDEGSEKGGIKREASDGLPGPPTAIPAWRRVARKNAFRDDQSLDSKDVEDQLKRPDSEDGSKYFPDWFDENDNVDEPEFDEPELDDAERVESPKQQKKKPKKASRKGKEPARRKVQEPTRPKGYDGFMSSISRAHENRVQNHATQALSVATAKPDKRNIPLGVHFDKAARNKRRDDRCSEKKRNKQDEGSTDETAKDPEGEGDPNAREVAEDSDGSDSDYSPSSSSPSSSSSSYSSSTSSSSSSHSSPSASSSSESGHGQRRKKGKKRRSGRKHRSKRRRKEERMLKRVKVEAPGVYTGKPDLDVFNRWAHEVRTWVRLNRLTEKITIAMLNKYVSGKASIYYMKYIAGREKLWTLTTIFEGLFDYCFPKDFKANLRRKLMTAIQGKSEVTDFARDLEIMADRFPDVNERSIIEIFWWGLQEPIRVRAVGMGANPERSTLDKMIKCAVRAEDMIRESERLSQRRDRDGRNWGRFANRVSGTKPYRPANEGNKPDRSDGQERVRANAVTPQPAAGPSRPSGQGEQQKRRGRKISRAKRDQLRADGKCFQCERTGHSQKDCPNLNTMRPPAITAGSVNIARLERFADARERADLQVGSVVLDTSDDCDPEATLMMWRARELCMEAWGVDDEWYNLETRRYGIYQYDTGSGELVEITDRDQPRLGVLEIDASRFRDPDFKLTDVVDSCANTDRSCVREGGFRDRRNYKIWEWSAIRWLRDLTQQLLLSQSISPCKRQKLDYKRSCEFSLMQKWIPPLMAL